MTAITLRIDEEKHHRLKQMAKQRGVTLNRLLDDMTSLMLTEFDLKVRYETRFLRGQGKTERGLELLQKARQSDK